MPEISLSWCIDQRRFEVIQPPARAISSHGLGNGGHGNTLKDESGGYFPNNRLDDVALNNIRLATHLAPIPLLAIAIRPITPRQSRAAPRALWSNFAHVVPILRIG
jgi:hypothetical protein